jgi:hypothetical protein
MKLKLILFISITFLLVACPSKEEDIYINLNSFNVQASCSNSENDLSDTIICNDIFKIYLDFGSSPIAQSAFFSTNVGVAYAAYEPIVSLQSKVSKCTIVNTEEFNNHGKNTDITNQFELCIDNSNWINELTIVEGINESVKLQYRNNVKPYLKLNSNPNIKYSGKFAVELELSDGTLFSDTTQYVIINTTK